MDSLAFLEQLKQTRLLSEDQLAEVRRRHSFLLPMHEFAGRLQAEGTLTTYQCKQIAAGKAKELVLGKYRILDELGRGGFGQVYKALHTKMNRIVAIKVIVPERVADSRAREWFQREQDGVAKLHHPNIAMSYDAGEENGQLYFVMEFVDGPNLHRQVVHKGPLAVPLACEMLRQAGLALQYAHENGFVHRDIKPANLLIPRPIAGREARGSITPTLVKVVDFGLARLPTGNFETLMPNGEKGLMGTPDYMAPEQARDHHNADIRSDLYSLGCSFYFALAGRRPFIGSSLTELITQHLTVEAPALEELRADVPAGLVNVIRRMMAKNPKDRFQTPADLIAAVEPLCETRAGRTSTSCRCRSRNRKPCRNRLRRRASWPIWRSRTRRKRRRRRRKSDRASWNWRKSPTPARPTRAQRIRMRQAEPCTTKRPRKRSPSNRGSRSRFRKTFASCGRNGPRLSNRWRSERVAFASRTRSISNFTDRSSASCGLRKPTRIGVASTSEWTRSSPRGYRWPPSRRPMQWCSTV